MQQPSHVLHFQPRANRTAQFLAQEGVACFQFVSYQFLPRFSHLCSRRKSVHFVVLSLCIGCWLVRFVSDSILCAGFTQAGSATP